MRSNPLKYRIFSKDFGRIKNKRKEYYNNVTPTVCIATTYIANDGFHLHLCLFWN